MADHLLEKKLFRDLKVSVEEIKKYYEEHQGEFTLPESVRVRQILTDTKEKADTIREKLEKGENFARLARALSIAPDRKQGGDLGFITRGSFPKEFEVCFDLKVGELSPVVSSLYGFHLFKVVEKRSETKLPLEEVRDQIEEWLKEQVREAAFQSYYEDLKKNYPVEIEQRVLKRVQVEG
jgi:parvulin-like peptidyl-prolyl isomerase